jgi:flagellar biosynthetic protein FliR
MLRFEILLPAFGLVLARVAGLVMAVPVFASSQIPRMVKVLLIFALSLMVFPSVLPILPKSLTLAQTIPGMVGELFLGEILGLAGGLVFFAAQLAGQIVSYQSGISLGQVVNPLMDEESSVLDQLWFFSALIFFLALRGHVAVVEALLNSFRQLPPMRVFIDGSITDLVNGLMQSCFEMALRLAGPVVLALLLTSLVLGFLTKTMPQLNIMTVGFSVKIAIALITVAVTISISDGIVTDGTFDALDRVGAYLDQLSGRIVRGV